MKEKIIEHFKSLTDDERHEYIKSLAMNLNKAHKTKVKHNTAYLFTPNDRRGVRGGKHSKLYANATNASDIYINELDLFKELVKLL